MAEKTVPPAHRDHPAPQCPPPAPKRASRCGCGPYRPACLQVCAVPAVFLLCVCLLVLVQSFVVSGYSSSILTTIEKRYDLWSSELGFIISSYDITAVLAGIVVSYFGDGHNRALWLSRGALLIGLGAIIFSLPHFTGDHYAPPNYSNLTNGGISICNLTKTAPVDGCEEAAARNPETWALGVFMAAFMLIGVGASPIYTLGPTYLYDNVNPARYPVYSGVMYSMGALGPAAGFLVGAALLQVYVHPGEAPPGLHTATSSWVGAWWIGFLLTAVLAISISVPLAFFPRQLPGTDHHADPDDRPTFASFGTRLKDFPKNLKKLLKNLTWLTITLVIVVEQSIGTGFNRFIAKYMQLSFNLPPSSANLFTGCVLIPAAVLGIISGGVVMNKLRPSLTGASKLLILLNFIPTIALATLFALGCDSVSIVGVTETYNVSLQSDELSIEYKQNLTAECNAGCQCRETMYSPVCGTNRRTYYSPCYAGCTHLDTYTAPDGDLVKNYSSCACIYDEFVHRQSAANVGRCDSGCQKLVPFLVILFIVVFLTTCGHNPALIITLRSVDPNARSFALGIQNFFIQILAFIPTPIYFGQIFDSQCILRTPRCEGTGACLEYDTRHLPYVLFGTCLGLKVLTFVFLLLTWLATRHREKRKDVYHLTDHPSGTTTPSTSVSTISVNYGASSNPGPGDTPLTATMVNYGASSNPGPGDTPLTATMVNYGASSNPGPGDTPLTATMVNYGASSNPGPGDTPLTATMVNYGASSNPGPGDTPLTATRAPSIYDPQGTSANGSPSNMTSPDNFSRSPDQQLLGPRVTSSSLISPSETSPDMTPDSVSSLDMAPQSVTSPDVTSPIMTPPDMTSPNVISAGVT